MKEIVYKVLYIVSALLALGFVILVGVDFFSYNTMLTSAPFYAFVLIRAIELLIPAVIVLVVALLLHKGCKSKEN